MSKEKSLNKIEHELLLRLIGFKGRQSNKVFDKQDCCFQAGMRKAAKLLGGEVTEHQVRKLFDTLTDKGLLKYVLDINGGERRMLNPDFMSFKRSKWETWFNRAVFALSSHSSASGWSENCVSMRLNVDPATGEVLGDLDVASLQKYRSGYTSTDRSKRRDCKKTIPIHLSNVVAANDDYLHVAA